MAQSANVKNNQALREFRSALIRFQDEARRALASLVVENERVLGWIQQERPPYWKRQIEIAHAELAEARASLTKCRMRRTGDFKPTCYDEKKAVERCKKRLELCHQKIEIVKRWSVKAAHEVDEYRARSNTMYRFLDGEIPRGIALLEKMAATLDKYANVNVTAAYDEAEQSATDEQAQTSDAQNPSATAADSSAAANEAHPGATS